MSGSPVTVNNLENGFSIHSFIQKIPIPSYLVAIVAGKL